MVQFYNLMENNMIYYIPKTKCSIYRKSYLNSQYNSNIKNMEDFPGNEAQNKKDSTTTFQKIKLSLKNFFSS